MDGFFLSGLMLFAALFFVALNGIFVLAEFSFATIRGTQVERLVHEGRASAGLVQEATRRLDAYLAVCQLGITISSLSLGALGEPAIASLIEPLMESIGFSAGTIHLTAFAIGFLIITSLHVVLGELVPKSIGIQKPEGASLLIAPFMRTFYYLFLPLMFVFNGTANAIIRAFGLPPASEKSETHTEEEVRMIISQAGRRGGLESSDEKMLEGIFELGETPVKKVMTPRPDVVALQAQTPLSELARFFSTGSHTRYPLFEEAEPERIVGIVHARDVLNRAEEAQSFRVETTAREIMRPPLTVTENKLLEDTLSEFRRRRVHLAVVIDEWGSFEGIVTMEDVLEEIVGNIDDEFDENRIEQLDSMEEPRVARMAVHHTSHYTRSNRSKGQAERQEELVSEVDGGEILLTEYPAIAAKVEALLEQQPGAEVELVLDARQGFSALKTQEAAPTSTSFMLADRARGSLLALLAERGLSVAVRGDTLRIKRSEGGHRLWKARTNKGSIYAWGRR